ncbi:MAG: TRAP transporter small permease [Alphaproteobacteria bacterium]|nr:MAG: TRAP transporter small permease [Alphaproteobacteria bacterium]
MTGILNKAVSRLVTAATIVAGVILILLMVQIVGDVLLSNLLDKPIPGNSVIVTNYYMIAVVFLPLALAEKRGDNITVEIAYQLMPRKAKNWTMYFSWVLSLIVSLCIVVSLWQAAIKKMTTGAFVFEQEINFTTWPAYFILPVSFGLLALVIVSHILSGPEDVESRALNQGL